MLKIRLTRVGKKHQPSYRMVVTPKENPVQGQYLDLVGTYNPIKAEVKINQEKVLEWLNKGAQPSDRISRLLTQAGITHKLITVKVYEPRPAKKAQEEKAAPSPATATTALESSREVTEEAPTGDITDATEEAALEENPEADIVPEAGADEENE